MAALGSRRAVALLALALALAGCSPNPPSSPTMLVPAFADPTDHIDLTAMSFAIEPFEGVPGNAADQLTNKIAETARREGLTVVLKPHAPARYRLKGWLTAVGNDTATTVVYVYEVLGEDGRRLHRIDGQEPSDGTDGDPWSAVTDDTITIIAERTVAALKAWLARDAG